MDAIKWMEEHPWTVAGVIGAGIVLYLVFSSNSSSDAVQQVPVNTDPSLQIAQLQLQGQAQQLNAQLAATQDTNNANVSIANLQAQLGLFQTSAAKDVSLAGIQAQEDVQLSGQQSQVQLAQITSDTTKAQIDSATQLGLAQAGTYAHLADVQAATAIAGIQAQSAAIQTQAQASVAQGWLNYWTAGENKKAAAAASTSNFVSNLVRGGTSLLTGIL